MDLTDWSYREAKLCCEESDLTQIAAQFGTPAYVYSHHTLVENFRSYRRALAGLPHKICFAVKANSNLAILNVLAREGAGFDIVSGGELYRVLAAGGDPGSVVFSGVGKTPDEISFALETGIHGFNCESAHELEEISKQALKVDRTASVSIRVNPDVDAVTHPYISTGLREHKFGVDIETAKDLYARAAVLPGLKTVGISCHIGSQLLSVEPFLQSAQKILALATWLREKGISITDLDLGGGLGVAYRPEEEAPSVSDYLTPLASRLRQHNLTLLLEPGRSVVAEAGVLLARVVLVKTNGSKTFVVVDAGMNDLMRPALYEAHHEIVPVDRTSDLPAIVVDVVGPVCETGDFFARDRLLSSAHPGDLLAIRTTGAYGFTLSSNYNSRPRPCELLVEGARVQVIRKRESYADLIRGESIPA